MLPFNGITFPPKIVNTRDLVPISPRWMNDHTVSTNDLSHHNFCSWVEGGMLKIVLKLEIITM
jgi:hypothetical protein